MARKELENLGFTIKDNGKVDFTNPPKGKKFVPIPTDEEDIKLRGIDRRFVTMHRFSATPVLVVMELIDDEENAGTKAYLTAKNTEYKEYERKNRCTIRSPRTGREIRCPESISCYSDECPMKMGLEVKTDRDASLEDMAETVKSSVCALDPTADEAISNVVWSRFKEVLRGEEPLLADIIEGDEYGLSRDEILAKLNRKKSEKSWYYYQWKRIRDRWEKYYRG